MIENDDELFGEDFKQIEMWPPFFERVYFDTFFPLYL
jgi:hypothetical protein